MTYNDIQNPPSTETAKHARLVQQVALLMVVAALGATTFYALMYFTTTHQWQTLGVGACSLTGGIFFIIAYFMGRRGAHATYVTYLLVGPVAVALPAAAFFATGMTFSFALGALVLGLTLTWMLLPPGKRFIPSIVSVAGFAWAYFIELVLAERLPFERMESSVYPVLQFSIYVIVGLMLLVLTWQLVRIYQNIQTIRVRLLVAFMMVSLLPVILVSVISAAFSVRSTDQDIRDQLQSVATLKQMYVEEWVDELESDMALALATFDLNRAILEDPAAEPQLQEYLGDFAIYEDFEALLIVDASGLAVAATDPALEGTIHSAKPYFEPGMKSFYIHPPEYSVSLRQMLVVSVYPIHDHRSQSIGVLVAYLNINQLNHIMLERTGLGASGETYLVGSNRAALTTLRHNEEDTFYVDSEGVRTALQGESGIATYKDYRGTDVIGAYRWVPELGVVLLAERDVTEISEAAMLIVGVDSIIGIGSALLALIVSLLMTRSIAAPLDDLADTAVGIAGGAFDRTAEVVRDDEIGALARAFNTMTDRLKATLSRTTEERNLLRTLIESIPDGIAINDEAGEILLCNEAYGEMVGAESAEALVGDTLKQYMPPEIYASYAREGREIMRTGKGIFDKEEHQQLPDGGERWILLTRVPIHSETGDVTGLVEVARDVTDRKAVELEHQRLANLIEATSDFVGIARPDGTSIYINPGGLEMTGYPTDTPPEALGIADFQPDLPPEVLEEAIREGSWVGEQTILHSEGYKIPVSQLINVFKDEQGNVISMSSIARDISDRVAMEGALRKREADSRESEERLRATVAEYLDFVQRVAEGDLTARLALDGGQQRHSDLYQLGENLNQMAQQLSEATYQIRAAAAEVSAAAAEIQAATTQQIANATQQDAAVSQTMTTVEEVRATVAQTASRARQVAEGAQESVDVSRSGQEAVVDTVEGMQRIRSQVSDIAENILMLSERTQQIGEIIAAVNDIADQSKMLALNASIEAARAGEEGKGFAVVAMEVRQLAEQSREATARVRDILQEIQGATNTAVMVTEEGSKGADQGMSLVEHAGSAIRHLTSTIEEAAQAAEQIAASTHQQTNGMEQLAAAMASIKQASTQTASSTRQAERSAKDLMDMAHQMEDVVARYKL